MPDLPFIAALCPTFRRPELLANSVALWEAQTYPADRRMLCILDDGGSFECQAGESWFVFASRDRHRTLPTKFNALSFMAPPEAEAFLVWEDDDVYLPGYVAAHAEVLAECELSKPDLVLSDYPGELVVEQAAGRFHSTLGFRRSLLHRIQGWPPTRRADFDQQFLARLRDNTTCLGTPWLTADACEFVYGWQTGHHHGQSTMDRGPADETWYDRAEALFPAVHVGRLVPQLDDRTRKILQALGRESVGNGLRAVPPEAA